MEWKRWDGRGNQSSVQKYLDWHQIQWKNKQGSSLRLNKWFNPIS